MSAVLLILLVGAANLVAFVARRHLAARLSGARGGWFTIGLVSDARSLGPLRALVAGAGPIACYHVSGALLAMSAVAGGKMETDEVSMRVVVAPGSPAEQGGLLTGDRILSVDDVPTNDWAGLRGQVPAHSGQPIEVAVERAGGHLVFSPTPNAEGRIGVGPFVETIQVGWSGAIAELLLEPARIVGRSATAVTGILAGHEKTELTGPVGIVKAQRNANSASLAIGLRLMGTLNAYYLWIPLLLASILIPWPMRARRVGSGRE